VDSEGILWSWGFNGHGQLGFANSTKIPQQVRLKAKAMSVHCGLYHTIILDEEKTPGVLE